MATILPDISTSLTEYRLLPGFTAENCVPEMISLQSPLCRQAEGFLNLQTPFISAAMQAVTGVELAIALAQLGGVGVLPVSQSVEEQCRKVEQIKRYKAGFQTDLVTFKGDDRIARLMEVQSETGYTIFPVTDSGLFHGRLTGVITDKDFDPRYDADCLIRERMKTDIQYGVEIGDLSEANTIMIRHGRGFLPIISREGTLQAVVFKKDLDKHIRHPEASVDGRKRLCVGAAISTHPEDRERAARLVEQEVDFLVIDASDGYSYFQLETLKWLKANLRVPVIAGNVVSAEAFLLLASAGADGIKIGMGIGSGCTTQEVKATGRGQATAIREIAAARDSVREEFGYIPLCADGSIASSAKIAIALALGADTVMMGNFFARFTEGNSRFIRNPRGETCKEYWMEGSTRGFNHRRYSQNREHFFAEGISGYVTYLGSLYNLLPEYRARLKATLITAGVTNLADFHAQAVLERISPAARQDSGVHNMVSAGNESWVQ